MRPVTDPSLLAQLNGDSGKEVTDPSILAQLNGTQQQASQPVDNSIDWKKAASDYLMHPAIEGTAMAIGAGAGAIVASPTGPIGSALAGTAGSIAMYPPAHQFANSIDQYLGIQRDPTSLGTDLNQGAKIEATSMALKPVLNAVGNLLPGAKTGSALSGTPPSNLKRAYQGGFSKTYLNPQPMEQSASEYATQSNKVLQNYLSPEEQAKMMVSPTGEANQKIADVYTSWLKKEPISAPDAVAAKQAISTVFPSQTAKNASKIAKLTDFEGHLNNIIGDVAPDFQTANANYAASKLRSQLLMPARVNKSNPNEYSKIASMLELLAVSSASGMGHGLKVAAGVVGTSPLAMGLISSVSGSTAKGISISLDNPVVSRAVSNLIARTGQN